MSDREKIGSEHSKPLLRFSRTTGAVACLISLGAGIGLGALTHNRSVTQVSEVECAPGEPFVGAFVKTTDGGNDDTWAEWDTISPDDSKARVSVRLPENTSYHLNVGCGGTKENWGRTPTTPEVVARDTLQNHFICDVSALAAGNCVLIP